MLAAQVSDTTEVTQTAVKVAAEAILTVLQARLPAAGGLTDAQLRAAALPLPSGAATEATLQQVRDAVKAQIDIASSVWTDNSGAYYVRRDLVNEGTGAITVSFTDATGTAATPGAGLKPLAMADRDVTQELFDATAGGSGYSNGDILGRVLIMDVSPATPTVTALWVNLTTGATISAPTGGTYERANETVGVRQVGNWSITNASFGIAGTLPAFAATPTFNMGTVPADPFGANADAASATGSISAKLRFMAVNTPALGFSAASASTPVVVGNDLTVLSTAAQSVLNTDLLTEAVNGWYDARAFHSASMQIIGGTGISAGAVFFEQTNDPTNAAAGRPWLLQEHDVLNSNPQGAAITIAASTQRIFEGPITAGYIRARISTAFTGGTVRLAAVLSQLPYQATRFNVQQATAASMNVTATVASTTVTSISAGTNAVGDVGVQYRANATGAASGAHIVSAASTNATIVKASAGRVTGWQLANTTASWVYVKLHNQTTSPTAGTGVVRSIGIPPNGKSELTLEGGIAFATGIALTIVTGAADADATAVTANAVVGDLLFA